MEAETQNHLNKFKPDHFRMRLLRHFRSHISESDYLLARIVEWVVITDSIVVVIVVESVARSVIVV